MTSTTQLALALFLTLPGSFTALSTEGGETIPVCPFGINNAYSASLDETGEYIRDLGVSWISDHISRRDIEKQHDDGSVCYDFSTVDGKIREYGNKAKCRAWFIINIESAYQFEDGRCSEWGEKTIRLELPAAQSATITELIPNAESGLALEGKSYPDFFKKHQRPVTDGSLTLTLKQSPLLVEAFIMKIAERF
ncbi:MAG: hypothetical protein HY360_02735 [Verrucomicrobia bacterium]|nr:hypothetical protein [Verrucomicrobiota bacterium]